MSFLGGGSDYPEFFHHEGGAVLGTTVDLFVYVALLENSPLANEKFRLTYRLSEAVNDPSLLQHPVVRSALLGRAWQDPGLHIATMADVPANTGLGSSSAFTVGLLRALNEFDGHEMEQHELAAEAIRIERQVMQEAGGWQDQYHAALGGLALYEFGVDGVSRRVPESEGLVDALARSVFLVPTGSPRSSHLQALRQVEALKLESNREPLRVAATLARNVFEDLRNSRSTEYCLERLSDAVREAWALKRRSLDGPGSRDVNDLVDLGCRSGALAGKLCGAGESGFVAFLVPVEKHGQFLSVSQLASARQVVPTRGGSAVAEISWVNPPADAFSNRAEAL